MLPKLIFGLGRFLGRDRTTSVQFGPGGCRDQDGTSVSEAPSRTRATASGRRTRYLYKSRRIVGSFFGGYRRK